MEPREDRSGIHRARERVHRRDGDRVPPRLSLEVPEEVGLGDARVGRALGPKVRRGVFQDGAHREEPGQRLHGPLRVEGITKRDIYVLLYLNMAF